MKQAAAIATIEKEQQEAANASRSAVLGYVSAFAGVGAVIAGVKGIADYFDQIRRDTIDAVKETIHFREVVLELAAMKGELGKSGPETGRQLAIVAQTAQNPEDSLAMSKAAEGAAQATIGKNISREAYDKGYLAAAKLQAMEGPGAGTAYGDLYGTLAHRGQAGDDRRTDGRANESRVQDFAAWQIQKHGRVCTATAGAIGLRPDRFIVWERA